jgi:hypothetical protein
LSDPVEEWAAPADEGKLRGGVGQDGEVASERRGWSDARDEAIVVSAARGGDAKPIMMCRAVPVL